MLRSPPWPSRLYRRYFLGLDIVLPIALAVLTLVIVTAVAGDDAIPESIKGHRASTYAAVAGVSGALCGFTMTLMFVTRTIVAVDALRTLRESPSLLDLFRAIMHAIVALGALTVFALLATLLDTENHPRVEVQYVLVCLFSLAAWKLTSAVRFMWRVFAIEAAATRRSDAAKRTRVTDA